MNDIDKKYIKIYDTKQEAIEDNNIYSPLDSYCRENNQVLFSKAEFPSNAKLKIKQLSTDPTAKDLYTEMEIIKPENNQIFYTSSDGNIVTGWGEAAELNVLSNIYENGQGIVTFDGEVESLIGKEGEREPEAGVYMSKNLKTCIIPDSLTTIGVNTFRFSQLEEFDTNNINYLGGNCFKDNSNLRKVIIRNVTEAGGNCFKMWPLTSTPDLTITVYGMTLIGGMIEGSELVTKVILSNSITTIEECALWNCENLTNITYLGTIEQWNNVNKGQNWHRGVPVTVVHCIDGDVNI